MKIGFVRVFVSDFGASLEFYTTKVGLKLDHQDAGYGWAQFHAGKDVSLAIERCDPKHAEGGSVLVGRFVGVTLMVEDVHGTYERMKQAGVEFTAAPEKQPWGGTLAHFKDPDGNILSLLQEGAFKASEPGA